MKCRACGKPIEREGNAFWPFCSQRCRIIDLGNWASGSYSIPGEMASDSDIEMFGERGQDEEE